MVGVVAEMTYKTEFPTEVSSSKDPSILKLKIQNSWKVVSVEKSCLPKILGTFIVYRR